MALLKTEIQNFDEELEILVKTYRTFSAIRPEVLFRDFLPTGYRFTLLNTVDQKLQDSAVFAKVHLGMLVTLYDDLADNPQYRNPRLLKELYKLNVNQDVKVPPDLNAEEAKTFELARFLFSQLTALLRKFSNYSRLLPILQFDIEQVYISNRYSELMTELPFMRNLTESRMLGAYNMAMLAAGTIDLMASSYLVVEELGACREVLLNGQRVGRISNLLFTLKREIAEGDFTNEILISQGGVDAETYKLTLLDELNEKLSHIQKINLKTFSTGLYAKGLMALHGLHENLEGRI
ncbi:hypothetical protein [Bdellovibrio bacteriovorus]|uniref:hypothetical protein n=1 Tax=Bdellovibrio TaxID=958 RepID=UPI0035A8C251